MSKNLGAIQSYVISAAVALEKKIRARLRRIYILKRYIEHYLNSDRGQTCGSYARKSLPGAK